MWRVAPDAAGVRIAPDELIAFKEFACVYLGLSGEALQTAIERGILEEIQ